MGLLPDTQNCGLRMRRECRERFPRPQRVSDPDMHHGTCVTHVPWCMPGLLTSGFLWSWWRGKRSRHSRRMRNPQFRVSGKRPIVVNSDKVTAKKFRCAAVTCAEICCDLLASNWITARRIIPLNLNWERKIVCETGPKAESLAQGQSYN